MFKMSVDAFYMMIIFVIWHDFDDATMQHEYIDIYILSFIRWFILGFLPWFYGFILDILWSCLRSYKALMDGPMKRPHMGLIVVVMCPHRGWCGWRFNHDGFGWVGMSRCHHVAYLGQHQCRACFMIFDNF